MPLQLPKLQAIRYPTVEGGDVVYGFRLIIPTRGKGVTTGGWMAEVGKIPDDSLKSHLVNSYVGLCDNFYYFKLETPEETHCFLASLFLADLITREEASHVLSKGPLSRFAATTRKAHTTIHRLPSLATLGGAFYTSFYLASEVVTLSGVACGGIVAISAPIAAGVVGVGLGAMVFSRSSRAGSKIGVREREVEREEGEEGTEMVVYERGPVAEGRRRVDVDLIMPLSEGELRDNALFKAIPGGIMQLEMMLRSSILPPFNSTKKKDVFE